MPSPVLQSVAWEAERAELRSVLQSNLFARSPTLTHLLSYLCEKKFAGETDQIKEYSVALDVFDRADTFDQDSDSIVRVQANRLRKRLGEYYASEGASHSVRITIPVGQYIPAFESVLPASAHPEPYARAPDPVPAVASRSGAIYPWVLGGLVMLVVVGLAIFLAYQRSKPQPNVSSSYAPQTAAEPPVGLPVGEEVHILAGATHKYVDHAGKLWSPDSYFTGGSSVRSAVQHIWRTQDPAIYRNSRQGDFAYDIPLKPGVYELHLHFAETFYGPENPAGGGEGSRLIDLLANGQPLLHDFDVIADSGGDRTADVKVFSNISPAADGQLHLKFSSAGGGSAMVSAIEILPGVSGHLRPVRIVARDAPYYSNDSRWWSPDTYFKGGQLSLSQQPTTGTDDQEFYETERWGHFSYAIPVAPGRYTVTLHFIERRNGLGNSDPAQPSALAALGNQRDHVFNVFCNGKTVLANLNIFREAGENHPLVKKIFGLVPNAQGKLLLEFVPVTRYATVTAIEVVPE
ncbi:MAG: malectin domain-containing carbohydrate-binding protein [Candidatus Sulfotelmatobacter sp.]